MHDQKTKITLAHSPDSDDAFMFWALAERLIDSGDIEFEHVLSDIQSLNQAALKGRYDVSAISLHAYPYVANQYALLETGASVGDGYGPILVAKKKIKPEDVGNIEVAIPGALTTAALVFRLAFPETRTVEMTFDRIPDAVAKGEIDAGLLIHEGQITYKKSGLYSIMDFGKWWKDETGLPLPLGVLIIRRNLDPGSISRISGLLKASMAYGNSHRAKAIEYSKNFGRDLTVAETDKFVGMYVNDFTLELGESGKRAVRELLKRASDAGIVPEISQPDFMG